MFVPGLIARKRDGHELTAAEWASLIRSVGDGSLPDYQLAALLMAVYLRGMSPAETDAMTDAMLASGARLRFPEGSPPRIDKHSTGGVGDKVSLVLAPIVSALGVWVPMMSGRGLGHTGGTLDKLESIPGFRTALSLDEAARQTATIGCALLGQSAEIAPADRRMYAMRDATSTVECIPLISASIMSKKLAEGLTGLVLDVKTGSGAFLPEQERGLALAQTMIGLGAARGCPTVALVTAMDRPLGRACGNALEVEESVHALHGEGPADLMTVTEALAVEMLLLAGRVPDADAGREEIHRVIASGDASRQFERIIEHQGGNPAVVRDPALLPQAREVALFASPRAGVVARVEPRAIGDGVIALGGGRSKVEDRVDPSVGFVVSARPGDLVEARQPLATVFARDEAGLAAGLAALERAIVVADEAPAALPLVGWRVTERGVERLGNGDGRD
ncbi:MAG: thymidine phosphorylase [Gemmatimonadaceae bacterium]|nr:thymidine phosphorylase [Gemmatimonadaceae bacterium]